MGTRSLTHIHDSHDPEKILVTIYRQMDGYPEGHGKELAEFLNGYRIVNGLCGDEGKIANGMGCLAAFIIAHFKKDPGHIYIYHAGATDCGEEYVYHVKLGAALVVNPGEKWPRLANEVAMSVADLKDAELFSGPPQDFAAFLLKLEANAE